MRIKNKEEAEALYKQLDKHFSSSLFGEIYPYKLENVELGEHIKFDADDLFILISFSGQSADMIKVNFELFVIGKEKNKVIGSIYKYFKSTEAEDFKAAVDLANAFVRVALPGFKKYLESWHSYIQLCYRLNVLANKLGAEFESDY